MDDNNLKIILTAVSFLASLFGILLNFVLSRKSSSELNRSLDICNNVIIEQFSRQINSIIKSLTHHFRNETSRVLEIAMREVSYFMSELRKDTGSENIFMPSAEKFNIEDLKISELDFDFDNAYYKIQKTHNFIKKIGFTAAIIKIFRWLFVFILAVILSFGVVIIIWPFLIPTWIPMSIFIALIIFFISFAINANKTSDLLDKVEKEYGISI